MFRGARSGSPCSGYVTLCNVNLADNEQGHRCFASPMESTYLFQRYAHEGICKAGHDDKSCIGCQWCHGIENALYVCSEGRAKLMPGTRSAKVVILACDTNCRCALKMCHDFSISVHDTETRRVQKGCTVPTLSLPGLLDGPIAGLRIGQSTLPCEFYTSINELQILTVPS